MNISFLDTHILDKFFFFFNFEFYHNCIQISFYITWKIHNFSLKNPLNHLVLAIEAECIGRNTFLPRGKADTSGTSKTLSTLLVSGKRTNLTTSAEMIIKIPGTQTQLQSKENTNYLEIDRCCPGGTKQCCDEPDLKQEHGQGPENREELKSLFRNFSKVTLNV